MHSITSASAVSTLPPMPKSRAKRVGSGAIEKSEPTIADAQTVGERIRAAYIAAGFNRHTFAQAMGTAYTTINAWEKQDAAPGDDLLRKASELTKVPPSVLRGEAAPVDEAQYEAWRAFLETDAGRSMSDGERFALSTMRFDSKGKSPERASIERYTAILVAMRGTR